MLGVSTSGHELVRVLDQVSARRIGAARDTSDREADLDGASMYVRESRTPQPRSRVVRIF